MRQVAVFYTERGSAEMVRRIGVPRRGDDGAREREDGQARSDCPGENKMNGGKEVGCPLG